MFRKPYILLFPIFLIFGCKEKREDKCETYFLSEITYTSSVTKFYYHQDGTLSSFTSEDNKPFHAGYAFNYINQKLISVTGINFHFRREFKYNGQGEMIAGVDYNEDNTRLDSVALEYDLLKRIVKRSFYRPYELSGYSVAEYLDQNMSVLKFYVEAGTLGYQLTLTQKFTYDSKVRPLPNEYYVFDIFTGNPISRNNIIQEEVIVPNTESSVETNEYQYNAGGFPVQVKSMNGLTTTSYKYTCTPIIK